MRDSAEERLLVRSSLLIQLLLQEKLLELERGAPVDQQQVKAHLGAQDDLFSAPQPHPIVDLLAAVNIDDLSPREALNKLYELKAQLD